MKYIATVKYQRTDGMIIGPEATRVAIEDMLTQNGFRHRSYELNPDVWHKGGIAEATISEVPDDFDPSA